MSVVCSNVENVSPSDENVAFTEENRVVGGKHVRD